MTTILRRAVLAVLLAIVAVLAGLGGSAGATAAAQIDGTITLAAEPSSEAISLGEHFALAVTVSNPGADASPPLVIHFDVTDPDQSTSVDPEDWTPTLSVPIGVLQPGQKRTVDWQLQPVSAGTYAAYAVALAAGVDNVATSNVVRIDVADRRTLNPEGILPIAIGVPVIVGGLLLAQIRLSRRSRRA